MADKTITVDSVLSKDPSNPIILHFGSGIGDSDGQAAIVKQNERSLVVTKQRGRFYAGLTEKDDSSLCHTYLAVQTPENKVVLVPVSCCNVRAVEKAIEANEDDGVVDKFEAVKKLALNFGSKRMKKVVNLKDKMTRDATVNSETVTDAVKGLEVSAEDLNDTVDLEWNINYILPPCDRNAPLPSLVYPLDNLLTPIERKSLEPTAKLLLENPPNESDIKYSYFMSHYFNLIGKNKMTLDKLVLMIYIDSLFNFITSRRKTTKKEVYCSFSKIIHDKIISEFTEDRRKRTTQSDDKAICYALVLILHLCDMQIHLSPVLTCFKGCSITRLKLLLRCIGVKQSQKKDVYTLTLPLPPLPKPSKKRKR